MHSVDFDFFFFPPERKEHVYTCMALTRFLPLSHPSCGQEDEELGGWLPAAEEKLSVAPELAVLGGGSSCVGSANHFTKQENEG